MESRAAEEHAVAILMHVRRRHVQTAVLSPTALAARPPLAPAAKTYPTSKGGVGGGPFLPTGRCTKTWSRAEERQ